MIAELCRVQNSDTYDRATPPYQCNLQSLMGHVQSLRQYRRLRKTSIWSSFHRAPRNSCSIYRRPVKWARTSTSYIRWARDAFLSERELLSQSVFPSVLMWHGLCSLINGLHAGATCLPSGSRQLSPDCQTLAANN